jgi:hypothetical protein
MCIASSFLTHNIVRLADSAAISAGMQPSTIQPHVGVAMNMPLAVSHWMHHERQRALAFQQYNVMHQSSMHAAHVAQRDRVEQMHPAHPAPREHTCTQNPQAAYHHHQHHSHHEPQYHHQHVRHDSTLSGHAMVSAWPDEQHMQPAWMHHNHPHFGHHNMMFRASAPFEWLPQPASTALPWGTWGGSENKPSASHMPDPRLQAAPFAMPGHLNLMEHNMLEIQDPCAVLRENKTATQATRLTPKDAHDAERPIAACAVNTDVAASTSHLQQVITEAAPTRRVSEVNPPK